ncbi:MAG: hypothetical protein FJ004_04380 [Chloroflexi bacterium]|nr:hypothetical protein [Chloroflexota bacterium]
MEQRKRIDIPVGTEVRSSSRVPIDGYYEFFEHCVSSDCSPSTDERVTYLMRGELVPRCKRCGKRGKWKLKDARFETTPDVWRKQTDYVLANVRGDRPDLPLPRGAKR